MERRIDADHGVARGRERIRGGQQVGAVAADRELSVSMDLTRLGNAAWLGQVDAILLDAAGRLVDSFRGRFKEKDAVEVRAAVDALVNPP